MFTKWRLINKWAWKGIFTCHLSMSSSLLQLVINFFCNMDYNIACKIMWKQSKGELTFNRFLLGFEMGAIIWIFFFTDHPLSLHFSSTICFTFDIPKTMQKVTISTMVKIAWENFIIFIWSFFLNKFWTVWINCADHSVNNINLKNDNKTMLYHSFQQPPQKYQFSFQSFMSGFKAID